MKLIFLAGAGCLAPVLAMTDADCKQADTNNDGSLTGTEATCYTA